MPIKRLFSDWTKEELEDTFGLTRVFQHVLLNDWFAQAEEFKIFSERPIAAIVGDYELADEPDAVIAKGVYSPKIPYFCFHEYKKENEPKDDPAAQALSAMLATQMLNPHDHPMYGLYVVGKMWYFMLLHSQIYCISVGHNALKDELFDIFKILKALKAILTEIAKQDA